MSACPHDRIEVTRSTSHGPLDDHETVDGYCKDCKALITGTIYDNGNVDVRALTPALGQWRAAS